VVGSECAPDPDLDGHLISADRVGLSRDLLVDATPGGVSERAEGVQRVHARKLYR
jgi:hypothetical protein